MASGTTPVRGRPYPLETDTPDVAADIHSLALNLDQVGNITAGTTLPGSGMVAGDEFQLTTTGLWYKYSGTAWVPLSVGTSGSCIIATSESRTNTVFGTLPTPDQVTGITLPASGLIEVLYQATWQESVSNAAQAAIMLNGVNVELIMNNGSVGFGAAFIGGSGGAGHKAPLSTFATGLQSAQASGTDSVVDVTTGQYIGNEDQLTGIKNGGPCYIFAAAGTYTVSIQFKASSGSVTVQQRRLYARAIAY